jgi:PAS domain S-box-containing protein
LDRSFTLTNLAQLAVTASPGQVQSRLDELLHTDKNIERYGLLDASGTVAAVAPLVDELGQNNIGKNFSNRPHFAQVKRTLQPMLTGVIMSRIGAPQPTVILQAPVVVDGQFGGYVFGKIALEQLQLVLENDIDGELRYVLVDKDENVIISNREDQKIMHPFVHGKGSMTPLDAGIMQWVPEARKNKPISERWKDSLYVLESPFKTLADWKLIIEQPIEPFQKILYKRYAHRLFLLFAVLLCSLGCAAFVSRRVLAATEKLSLITVDLAPRLAERDPNLQWPVSNLTETNQLICNFKSMADELTVQFTVAQQAKLILEERVQERTQELRESRNLFRTLASHAPVGIFQADTLGQCIFVNAKWCELAGLSEEQATGMGWRAALHPEDRERTIAAWEEAVCSARPFSCEYRFVTSDGTMNWVYGVAVGVEQSADTQVYTSFIGCVVDITERKRTEDALRDSKERAMAADEAKTQLLSTVAHEFRTPLALLNSSLEILDGYSDRLNSEQRRNQEQLIRKAVNQLKVLVDTVLSYNQMDSSSLRPLPRTQHLGTLVAAIADEVKLAWAGAHTFHVDIAPECGLAVLDEVLFRRIVENLLANAFQYTNPGGQVALHVFQENGWLQMTVADQGIGIAESDQERVFEPFYRGQNVESRRGMGLGLNIVRDALLQLNGTITMASVIGQGTTFTVQIPLQEQ